MNKKAFTLAELIAVIVILSLIVLITVPSVSNVLKQNKITLCKNQLANILIAADSYASENILAMPNEENDSITITIGDLIEQGFISENMTENDNNGITQKYIQNPVNKEPFSNDIEIRIGRNGKKLDINYTEEDKVYNLCEDYE